MLTSSHDSLYIPPVGQGFNADDLARKQLEKLEELFTEQLPALVELGTAVYVEKLRQDERMKALDVKLKETLSPEHSKRAREIFTARAEVVLKAEAATKVVETQNVAIIAAETRIQAEKRQNKR